MFEISLPVLDWFLSGNEYSGSAWTSPERGCFSVTTFNYKVKLDKAGQGFVLFAACWFALPFNAVSNVDEITIGRFEASQFGLEVAQNWLMSKCLIPFRQADSLDSAGYVPLMPHR